VRALGRRLREPLDSEERGKLLETLVFNELRAQIAYSGCGGELSYWRTPSGSEVDFVWTRGAQAIGIEVKSAKRWRGADGRVLRDLHEGGTVQRCFAVYAGAHALEDGPIRVLPFTDFARELSEGRVLAGGAPMRPRKRGGA
jgi:predicted AAA+ superfamily ATPase